MTRPFASLRASRHKSMRGCKANPGNQPVFDWDARRSSRAACNRSVFFLRANVSALIIFAAVRSVSSKRCWR
ncbi:hypothetical protein ASC90_14540 [Rhizobium sp. Root1220]|nr:hypothetical protein ASC90_14540 [Rhizobium sp. Root1220]